MEEQHSNIRNLVVKCRQKLIIDHLLLSVDHLVPVGWRYIENLCRKTEILLIFPAGIIVFY